MWLIRSAERRREEARLERRVLVGLALVVAAAAFLYAIGEAAGPPASPPARPSWSVKDSPGWYPPDDPESLAVARGRREAPLAAMPFRGGEESLRALGERVLAGLVAGSLPDLEASSVGFAEFAAILWPEFPESRPATGLRAEDAWFFLERRLRGGLAEAIATHAGRSLSLRAVERTGPIRSYRNFRIHEGVVLVVENEAGQVERLDFLRAVAERQGRFKVYSVTD